MTCCCWNGLVVVVLLLIGVGEERAVVGLDHEEVGGSDGIGMVSSYCGVEFRPVASMGREQFESLKETYSHHGKKNYNVFQNSPLVVRNHATDYWDLVSSFPSLRDAVIREVDGMKAFDVVLEDIKVSHKPDFMYADDSKTQEQDDGYQTETHQSSYRGKDIAASSDIDNEGVTSVQLNLERFLEAVAVASESVRGTTASQPQHHQQQQHPSSYVYYSGDLSSQEMQFIVDRYPSLPGIDDLWPAPLGGAGEVHSKNDHDDHFAYYTDQSLQPSRRRYAWIGSQGAYTHMHFDDADNMYTQVHGVKEFYLLPPTAMFPLHLFPALHESARQSQARAVPPLMKNTYDDVCKVSGAQHVKLQPGDTLFLPAGWFHFVRATTTSFSINEWKQSPSSLLLSQLFTNSLPFYSKSFNWPMDQLKLAVQGYVLDTVAGVMTALNDRKESELLLMACPSTSQGKHWSGRDQGEDLSEGCAVEFMRQIGEISYGVVVSDAMDDGGLCSLGFSRNLHVMLKPYARHTASHFDAMASGEVLLYLSTWVQAISATVVHPHLVGDFLVMCI